MAAIIYQAVQLGLEIQHAIWDLPMSQILLLIRQKTFMESDKPGIQLSLMESIDNNTLKPATGT